jgi:hypothetical protein
MLKKSIAKTINKCGYKDELIEGMTYANRILGFANAMQKACSQTIT